MPDEEASSVNVLTLLSEDELRRQLVNRGSSSRPSPPYSIIFPALLVEQAAHHLWQQGQQRLEQLALWAGTPTSQGIVITALLLPETEATWGWVHVLPAEQPRIVDWLRRYGQLLFAESHTHGDGPWATELSDEDRRHPAGRQNGFLTIIVPGYARDGIDFRRAGVWECRELSWYRLPLQAIRDRLRMVSDQEARDALR
jgi:hypothetical protein